MHGWVGGWMGECVKTLSSFGAGSSSSTHYVVNNQGSLHVAGRVES